MHTLTHTHAHIRYRYMYVLRHRARAARAHVCRICGLARARGAFLPALYMDAAYPPAHSTAPFGTEHFARARHVERLARAQT